MSCVAVPDRPPRRSMKIQMEEKINAEAEMA
jgi:hypothetical protein